MRIRVSSNAVRLRLELIYTDGCLRSVLRDGAGHGLAIAETKIAQEALRSLDWTNQRELGNLLLSGQVFGEVRRQLERGTVVLALSGSEEETNLPWEYAIVPELWEGPLALHPRLSLLRTTTARECHRDTKQRPRLLLAMANPGSARFPSLDFAEAELESVLRALEAPECRGLYVELLRYATPAGLRRAISERPPSILHFIGHAERRSTGVVLALEGGHSGAEELLYVDELLPNLQTAQTQLLVLSACNSALAPGRFGTALTSGGLPAFIGMQRPLSDAGAQLLSRALYAALAAGASIDEALRQARLAVSGMPADWGAPALVVNEWLLTSESVDDVDAIEGQTARSNLPVQLKSFVGRESDVAYVRYLLQDNRFVSLVGPGGIGKTRLAIEAAKSAASDYAEGLWFVGLENIQEASAVEPAFAESLGIRDAGSLAKTLADRLVGVPGLIVVDNCEHLRDETARILETLLGAASRLQIIATSRTPVGIAGEQILRVGPLPLPSPDDEDLPENPSLRLFTDRAMLVNPGFEVSRANSETLCRLVSRLDGIPLAIELAAAHAGVMSLDRLVELLEATFSNLGMPGRGGISRQETLGATMAWSLGLLNRKERCLFARLGVFGGSWSLEAAEEIAGVSPIKREEALKLLVALVDHSLVTAEPMANGEVRYRYLQTIREAARTRLRVSRDASALHRRFFVWLSGMAERLFEGIHGPEQLRCRQTFTEELDNFRVAVSWGLDQPEQITDTAHLLLHLGSAWMMHSGLADAIAYFDRLEPLLPEGAEGLRARVRGVRGRARLRAGKLEGLEMLREAVRMAEGVDPAVFSWAVFNLGTMLIEIGELDEAEATFNWAASLEGQERHTLRAYPLYFGILAAERGLLEDAERIYRNGLSDPVMVCVPRDRGLFLGYLAVVRDLLGEPDAAELYREGLADLAEVGCYQSLACLLPAAASILLPDFPESAVQVQSYADRLLEETNVRLDPHVAARAERAREATVRAVGREYTRLYAAGRLLNMRSALILLGIETSPVRLAKTIRNPLPNEEEVRL